MNKIKLLSIFIVLLFLNCQPLPGGPPVSEDRKKYVEVPDELKQRVEFAASMGELIYQKDNAAELATDELMRRDLATNKDIPLRGWITVKNEDGGWKVIFISEKEGIFKGHYTLGILNHKIVRGSFRDHNTGLNLTPEQLSMFKARQLAVSQKFRRCSIRYNTVVIPRKDEVTGKETIYVYLLAAISDSGDIPVIGHHRAKVSQNGDKLLEFKALSNTCMSLPPDATIAASAHILDPTPIETHVFFSLQQGYAIDIITVQNRLTWRVDGNQIRLLQEF